MAWVSPACAIERLRRRSFVRASPVLDEAPVTRRQRQASKLARSTPSKRDVLVARRLAQDAHRSEDDQERRVWIGDRELLVSNLGNLDAQLFMELATRGIRVRLSGLALAAGKLPEPAVSFVVRALADEELVSARHHGGDDPNRR
jgi:hypothetical protein